jgi:hypothetical protein
MSAPRSSIDDAPFGAFRRRLALYSCGGYILGVIAIALAPLSQEIGLVRLGVSNLMLIGGWHLRGGLAPVPGSRSGNPRPFFDAGESHC